MIFIITYLDSVAPLIPILIFLKPGNRKVLKEYAFLFIYFLSILFFHTIANILSFYPFPNYFVYHISLPVTFCSLLLFLRKIRSSIFLKIQFFKFGLVLVFLVILNSLFYETYTTFNSISYAMCSLFILIVCLNYYWNKIKSDGVGDLLKEPAFWIISGLFIYYSSSFGIFSAYRYFIKQNNQFAGLAWRFHNAMLLTMCLIISKGLNVKKHA